MSDEHKIPSVVAAVLSPHNRALYEAGKKLLVDSIETGRDYCKTMISGTVAAVPVYLGMLKFVGIVNARGQDWRMLAVTLIWLPCAVFLTSSVVFTIGYFPSTGRFSLDIIEEIEVARQRVITRRSRFIVIGTVLFVLGVALAALNLLVLLLN